MEKNKKQQYKHFNITSTEDACLVLGSLICEVIVNLEKYAEYIDEAEKLLESSNDDYIPAKEYDDIHDKLLFRQREILKYSADYQHDSFSYISLREQLKKDGFLSSAHSKEMKNILNTLRDDRNWSFHNPQSLMVSAKEIAAKNVDREFKGIAQIVPQLNPVIVQVVERYERQMLATLILHTRTRIEQFIMVLQSMQADYQEIYKTVNHKPQVLTGFGLSYNVQYHKAYITARIDSYQSDIAQLSMGIQKSKYDGTDETFNAWTVRSEDKSIHEE